jgi:hypothetical protein
MEWRSERRADPRSDCDVLYADGQPMQRSDRFTPAKGSLCGLRRFARLIRSERDNRIELRIEHCNRVEMRVEHLDRTDVARAQQRREFARGSARQAHVGHPLDLYLPAQCTNRRSIIRNNRLSE